MVRKLFVTALFCIFFSCCAIAQDIFDRTNDITLFHDFQPALITLANGSLNRQPLSNVFLRKSTFVYKKGNDVLEANMQVIKSVSFGERTFVNIGSQLAEVLDSVDNNMFVLVRVINQEGLSREIINNSTITSLSTSGDQLGVTRLDADPDMLRYPIDNKYYFVINGKAVLAQDREARHAVGRKKWDKFDGIVKSNGFSWTKRECLLRLLSVFSD